MLLISTLVSFISLSFFYSSILVASDTKRDVINIFIKNEIMVDRCVCVYYVAYKQDHIVMS